MIQMYLWQTNLILTVACTLLSQRVWLLLSDNNPPSHVVVPAGAAPLTAVSDRSSWISQCLPGHSVANQGQQVETLPCVDCITLSKLFRRKFREAAQG